MRKRKASNQGGVAKRPRLERQQRMIMYRPVPAALVTRARTEVKTVDTSGIDVITSTPNITLLNGVAEGTGFFNRVGRKFSMRSMHFRGYFAYDGESSPSDDPDYWRVVVLYDRQINGAPPAIEDVFQEVPNTGTPATPDSMSSLNLNNSDRFKVLVDVRLGIASGTNTVTQVLDGQSQEFTVNRYSKLGGLEVQCKGSTAAVSDISTGGLWLITWGQKAIVEMANPCGFNFIWRNRLRYTDA